MRWKRKAPAREVPSYKIRVLRTGDAERVVAIDRSSYRDALDGDMLLRMAGNRSSSCRVVVLDGMVPYVAGYVVYTLRRPAIVIDRLAVDPEYRRLGLGRALVGAIPCGQSITDLITLIRSADADACEFARSVGMKARAIHRGPPEVLSFAMSPRDRGAKEVTP